MPNGALRFGDNEKYTEAADIAAKLKGVVPADNAPKLVDFRGCSVGGSPKAMEQIRAALGASSVVAGTCFAVIQRTNPPIKIGDNYITKASDVTAENRPLFEKLMKGTFDHFGPAKKCIINRSEKDFFAAGGRFVALWFNPTLSKEFLPDKSICYKDVTPETVDPNKALSASNQCRLIMVETKPETQEK